MLDAHHGGSPALRRQHAPGRRVPGPFARHVLPQASHLCAPLFVWHAPHQCCVRCCSEPPPHFTRVLQRMAASCHPVCRGPLALWAGMWAFICSKCGLVCRCMAALLAPPVHYGRCGRVNTRCHFPVVTVRWRAGLNRHGSIRMPSTCTHRDSVHIPLQRRMHSLLLYFHCSELLLRSGLDNRTIPTLD